ncbi:MAG: hypothetical protein KC636_01765, partial [Myxococcales bacterium]|nr:hypothetical protein [Myxococcales bacterium]
MKQLIVSAPVALALALAPLSGCGGGEEVTSATDTASGTDPSAGPSTGDDTDPTGSTGDDGFGDEDEYELRLKLEPNKPLELEMNKEQARELFGETAKEILLIEVDTTNLLVNTLNEIKNACGTDWKKDDEDPNHDCTQTPLGQSFGPDWECSPEFSMVRLLTMTPANSKVDGTSISSMQFLADLLGIGGGFGEIMAASLGIARTDEFINTENLVLALQADMLASHPNMNGSGVKMPVTMFDALWDFAPMGETFGPAGPHPGILAPGFAPYSDALTDQFTMRVVAESNLRLLEGVDADTDKEFLSIVADNVGPTFNDALEFDFEDPDKFSITGVDPDPRLDLQFAMGEDSSFISSCTEDVSCFGNLPGAPVNQSSVWSLQPWVLEYVISHAGLFQYEDRQFDECYEVLFSCGLGARVMIGPNMDFPTYPLGWAHFVINAGLLADILSLFNAGPPEAQYVWDLINEIGQVILHEPPGCEIPEGQADVEFTLRDIPIGISGAEIAESVRPYLQEQKSDISALLLGNYKENNGKVDFYYRAGADGFGYLFFVHQDDQAEGASYLYQKPGFYSCP